MFGCFGRWENYWEEQVKVIEWTQTPEMLKDPILNQIDHTVGYGVAGHSMGGQATARSSIRADIYNIKAAILFHPYHEPGDNIGAQIQVPLAGFTGDLDDCCGEEATRNVFFLIEFYFYFLFWVISLNQVEK